MQDCYHHIVDDATENRSDSVDLFCEDKGDFANEDISEQTSAATCGHTEENHEKGVVGISQRKSGVDPHNGEHAEADGIENIVDAVDVLEFGFVRVLYNAGKYKGEQSRAYGKNRIYIIAEHNGRQVRQKDIADHAAAEGGDDTAKQYPENVQTFFDADHGTGNGKSAGADDF